MFGRTRAFSEKFGIHIDSVNTNKHSDVGTPFRSVTSDEQGYIQMGVEKVYDTFIGRVAEGRNTSKEMIDSIGQGRVWSGADAIKINLVDELGGLEDAIAYAAKKANVDYATTVYAYAKTSIALFDAFIQCWDAKYTYNSARPETVINKYI